MTKLKRLLNRLRLLLYDNYNWVLVNDYKSYDGDYVYKSYICVNTGMIKRYSKFVNKKPIIKITKS